MNKVDEHGLYGIYDVWYTPFWSATWFKVTVTCAIVVLLSLITWLVVRMIRARKPKLLPWQVALVELASLDIDNLADNSARKEFYVTLTVIIKRYLQKRYGYDLSGKTDIEVLQMLHEHKFTRELLEELEDIIAGGIKVKFANEMAVQQQIEHDLVRSIELIKKTIPVPDETESESEKK